MPRSPLIQYEGVKVAVMRKLLIYLNALLKQQALSPT